jgi:hypothetical protein
MPEALPTSATNSDPPPTSENHTEVPTLMTSPPQLKEPKE